MTAAPGGRSANAGARSERERRRRDDALALEAWTARRAARLAREPAEVRAEIVSEARARLLAEGRIDWRDGDSEICRMRVVSRHRLKRYGAIPDGQEWRRQVAELRATLGLEPRTAIGLGAGDAP